MPASNPKDRQAAALHTPTDLGANATRDVSAALNLLLADTFALYVKTKNSTGTCPARISATITCSWTSRPTRFSR
jgi:hypothetical protein